MRTTRSNNISLRQGLRRGLLTVSIAGLTGFSYIGFFAPQHRPRELDSTQFPRHELVSNVDDILSHYDDYLRFALEAGRAGNPQAAKRLETTFESLRRSDPQNAARFLRGLRFEMTQKLELMGAPPRTMNSANPTIRKWAARFLPTWQREADEYLFRSRVARLTKE